MSEAVLRCVDLGRTYIDGERRVVVLEHLSLSLAPGERLAVIGSSGSGKSTLLNLLGGLDQPSAGYVEVAGRRLDTLSESERCRWRNRQLGFVFQFHHLLPEFTALEAVAMPARIAGLDRRAAADRAEALLAKVGMAHRLEHRPGALSGGERQRVAIARALVNDPDVVLMDEPTGNLDPEAAAQVLGLIDALTELSSSFVVVTHDPGIARRMDRQLRLVDRRLEPVVP